MRRLAVVRRVLEPKVEESGVLQMGALRRLNRHVADIVPLGGDETFSILNNSRFNTSCSFSIKVESNFSNFLFFKLYRKQLHFTQE